jgi:hypothetical protein
VPHLPRFRALALFGRRPLQRGEGLVIAGGRKPTHKQTFAAAAVAALADQADCPGPHVNVPTLLADVRMEIYCRCGEQGSPDSTFDRE